jgi:radical SAM family uncharacterized protein/radical SAM-linked protein
MELTATVEKDFLPFINKPGRFTGNEYNAVRKDPATISIRVALAFPEIYELGMSYVGFDILYHILNSQPDIWAERVYAPWFDAEQVLRSKKIPLFSLESRTPLTKFDWIGFTLQYELTYSTLLNMLDLSGIPLHSSQRDEDMPFIIAGGPSTSNPEPLADFIDGFLIGDGEEAVLEISRVISAGKQAGRSRETILADLAAVSGMYIPSFYRAEYDSFGDFRRLNPLREGIGLPINKRIIPGLKPENYPMNPLVPLIEITHNRLSLEIMRGCSEGCRFCNAGMIYRPVRERTAEEIILQSRQAVESTGFDEISLLSLNTSDYSDMSWLMLKEKMLAADRKVSFSFPSLRLDGLTPDMVEFVRTFKKTGFTFAPEAGSQRLRNVINKNIREEDLLDSLRMVLENGWQLVKFYFMIGLPTEKQEDLDALLDLIGKCRQLAASYKDVRFNISISPFSPKPHTPFQWEKQEGPEELERKSRYIFGKLSSDLITVNWRDGYTSSLETIFIRGGRKLGAVLETAWKNGARFDGWNEGFNWNRWEEAFREHGIDWKTYLRPVSVSVPLLWDHIDMGISRSFLEKERLRAYEGQLSKDCREYVCLGCGLQRQQFRHLVDCIDQKKTEKKTASRLISLSEPQTEQTDSGSGISFGRYGKKRMISAPPVKKKIRLRFSKTGLVRFISHLDVVRVFDRAARRANISLVYSRGFHPRPKLAFGPPLGLGIASVAEYLDVEAEMGQEGDFQIRLNQVLPEGMQILAQKTLYSKVPSLSAAINRAVYETELDDVQLSPGWIQDFLARTSIEVERPLKEGSKTIDIKPFISQLEYSPGKLYITLDAIEGRSAKVTEVLDALFKEKDTDPRRFFIQRTGQFIVKGDRIIDPLDVS